MQAVRKEEAIAFFHQSLRINPDDPRAHRALRTLD